MRNPSIGAPLVPLSLDLLWQPGLQLRKLYRSSGDLQSLQSVKTDDHLHLRCQSPRLVVAYVRGGCP